MTLNVIVSSCFSGLAYQGDGAPTAPAAEDNPSRIPDEITRPGRRGSTRPAPVPGDTGRGVDRGRLGRFREGSGRQRRGRGPPGARGGGGRLGPRGSQVESVTVRASPSRAFELRFSAKRAAPQARSAQRHGSYTMCGAGDPWSTLFCATGLSAPSGCAYPNSWAPRAYCASHRVAASSATGQRRRRSGPSPTPHRTGPACPRRPSPST